MARYSWTNIGTIGTVALVSRAATLRRIVIPGTFIGSVSFFDTSATAGTAASNLILTVGLPASGVPNYIDVDANCKDGLVFASTGTPAMTVLWE